MPDVRGEGTGIFNLNNHSLLPWYAEEHLWKHRMSNPEAVEGCHPWHPCVNSHSLSKIGQQMTGKPLAGLMSGSDCCWRGYFHGPSQLTWHSDHPLVITDLLMAASRLLYAHNSLKLCWNYRISYFFNQLFKWDTYSIYYESLSVVDWYTFAVLVFPKRAGIGPNYRDSDLYNEETWYSPVAQRDVSGDSTEGVLALVYCSVFLCI